MNETIDPDSGKSRAETIAELRRMKAALGKREAEAARDRRRIAAIERELRALGVAPEGDR